MIIDAHVHVWDEGYQPRGYKLGMAKGAAYRRLPFRDPVEILPRIMPGASNPDGDLLIAEMDKAGVDAVVAMTVDFGIPFDERQDVPIEDVIEHHAELTQRYPGRFYAFFGMDPRRPQMMSALKRAHREWGFKGVKLYPACGFHVSDPVCRPVLQYCVENGLPVLVHTASVAPPLHPKLAHPIEVSEIASHYPDIQLIYGHAGHPYWWQDALQVARQHPFSTMELSMWNEVALSQPEKFIPILGEMRDRLGAHRILMGTDFAAGPATVERGHYKQFVDFMRALPEKAGEYGVKFSQDEVDLIMGDNTARILGLT